MNAVAVLLVHHGEIVAVSTPQSQTVFKEANTSTEEANTLEVLALEEAKNDPDVGDIEFVNFTALANANQSSPSTFPSNTTCHYMIVLEGESSWPDIKQDAWSQIGTVG